MSQNRRGTLLLTFAPGARAEPGEDFCVELLRQVPATGVRMVTDLAAFARTNNLPVKVITVGPPQKRRQRLVVGVDVTNAEQMKSYLEHFNLDQPIGEEVKGTLVLEFQAEKEGEYVTGALRTSPDPNAPIYRWGRKDLSHTSWWSTWMTVRKTDAIFGFSHLIGLTAGERQNVQFFLDNPAERGACKSDNCVAWTSNIELGETKKGATPEARQHLFSVLGMARAMAHFEIGRRLVHAADERHSTMVAFLNGEKGVEAFANVEEYLPPEPKLPYKAVIKNMKFADDSPVMKAVAEIPDGAKIFIPIAAGASPEGVAALIQRAETSEKGFDVHVLVNGVSESTLREGLDLKDHKFRLHSLFLGANQRALYKEGKVKLVPGYLSDFTRYIDDPRKIQFHYDAIVVRVAPADAQGRFSLGPNNDHIMTIIRKRPGIKIIAEVNKNIPRTHGLNFLTAEQIAATFESNAQLAGPPVVPLTEIEKNIGDSLAGLIEDGAYLQIGIGNIFGGLAPGMVARNRRNIKIFTEMFGDPLKDLVQQGVASEAKTGFAFGSEALYKWLDGNESVEFLETEFINDPGRVAALTGFHAVNTALQVNLHGDVNATIGADGVRMSSPGGQVEFMAGAARSRGGKAIIAMRSTARNGELSTIALDLYRGPVTTPHESVTHVVTEYGVAELAGKSDSERAIELIKIAHPRFRDSLARGALDRKLLSNDEAQPFLVPVAPVPIVAPPAHPRWKFWKRKGWWKLWGRGQDEQGAVSYPWPVLVC